MNKNHRVIAPICVLVSMVILLVALFTMRFIPLRIRLLILFSIIAITMVIMIVTKKSVWRYLLSALIIIVSIALVSVQWVVNDISDTKDFEVVEYSVYQLNENVNHSLKVIGVFGVKENHESEIQKAYLDKEIEYRAFPTLASMLDALYGNEIDALIINKTILADISTLRPKFANEATSVDSFTFKEPRVSIAKEVDVTKESFIIYLSGIDVFGDVVSRSRSDMNLLLVINPATHKVLSVTTPRDTYLPLGCETKAYDKLTHAGIYGVACSVKTLEKFYGVDINYYMRLNFTGLVEIVDALDGVDVLSHYTFDTDGGFHFTEGMNHVNGEQALSFARERDHIDYGDVSRGMHHQELVKAIFMKSVSPQFLMKTPQLFQKIRYMIDTNLSDYNLSRLIAEQIDNNGVWQFEEVSLSGTGDMQPTYSQDDNFKYYVSWPDTDSLAEIKIRISEVMNEKVAEDGA